MPDPPDKGRPSSPLSAEDADRLADSFTPFWEDAGAPVASAAAPAPALTPNPGTVTAPMPAVEPLRKPVGKQTLLGIAPLVIERPAATLSAPPAEAVQVAAPVATAEAVPTPGSVPTAAPIPTAAPVPALEPVSTAESLVTASPLPAAVALTQPLPATAPVAAPEPVPVPTVSDLPSERVTPARNTKTRLGYSDPSGATVPTPIARAAVTAEAVQQSSPAVPGYAIAYTPKDPPSTPAVVIAPEAQSSPENLPPENNKRQFSQTVPSRVRSAPNASAAPLPPAPARAPAPAADDFNPYAPKKGKGKAIGLGLSGALLILGAVVGVRTLGGTSREPDLLSAPRTDVVQAATPVAAAPTLAPAKLAETAEPPMPTPVSPAAAEPAPAAAAAELPVRRVSEPPPPKVKAKAASARPVTRAPAPEPSPIPTKPASKSVIVRDAPF